MKRHNLDSKVNDFTWKQNRLSKDKEALKNSMLDVIRKKPKVVEKGASVMPKETNGGLNSGLNTGMGAAQGYGGGQGGNAGTMMGMQQAPAAY
jgi:hypothetical protein